MTVPLLQTSSFVNVERPRRILTAGPLLAASTQREYGPDADPGRSPTVGCEALVAMMRDSVLDGRGGAGFPVWRKLEAAASHRVAPDVVANLCEGEPWSAKDHILVKTVPNLIVEGLDDVRVAMGAAKAHIVAAPDLVGPMQRLLRRRGLTRRIRVWAAEPRYVSGESSAVAALVHSGGRQTLPRFHLDPLAAAQHPSLVHNAETLAWIALIARRGPQWFLRHSTRLVTITGAVAQPGVVETRAANPLDVIDQSSPSPAARYALVGGVTGRWARPGDVSHGDAELPWGVGSVRVLQPQWCPFPVSAEILDWLADQSAGQCGPCALGLPALAQTFRAAFAAGRPADCALDRWTSTLGRGACHHPRGVIGFARHAVVDLAAESAAHRERMCCARTQPSD